MNGRVIAIEGVDASGKETQSKILYKRLKEEGKNVIRISFPDYASDSSALVKMYLSGAFGEDPSDVTPYVASTFYAADRFASFKTKWKSHYESGGIVIADRYATANMIHQASKIDSIEEKEIFLSWLWQLEFEIYKIPKPDMVFFLNMPPDVSHRLMQSRQNKITGEQEKDIHEKDQRYLAKSYENAHFISERYHWHVIDCAPDNQLKSIEEIHAQLYNTLKSKL